MRVLDSILTPKSIYLKNGLFWCFRPNDEVSNSVVEILERTNAFFVLSDGFDETMAEFYSVLGKEITPFNTKLASDRASSVIDTYLANSDLKASKSPTIRRHLEALELDKNASMLSDLMKELNSEQIASSGISDKHLQVYLEVERAFKARDIEAALQRLREELEKSHDRRFKELLLGRLFLCCIRLNQFSEAKRAVGQILNLDSANFYMALNECSLLESRADRIAYLLDLKRRHPYSAPVLNRFADELNDAIIAGDKNCRGLKAEDVIQALKQSTEIEPSVGNRAWSLMFTFYSKQGSGVKIREALGGIVDKHLTQAPFNSRSSRILFRFCRKFKESSYNNKPIYEYLKEGYDNHFPRDFAAHLDVIVDACMEFETPHLLRPILEGALTNEDLANDPQFAETMMTVHYDVFRDLPAAITYGREFLRKNKNTDVEVKLFHLYLDNDNIEKARQVLKMLKGAIELGTWLTYEAKIFEYEGRFQNAIDTIESIPDKRDFKEQHVSGLSYLELKMNAPAKALKRCKEFLEDRNFSFHLETEIINYEYARKLDSRKINKERISSLGEKTDNELVKAVCNSLLENDKEVLKILEKESHKRFSVIDLCLRWPVLSRHSAQMSKIRNDLLLAKRSLTSLPLSFDGSS